MHSTECPSNRACRHQYNTQGTIYGHVARACRQGKAGLFHTDSVCLFRHHFEPTVLYGRQHSLTSRGKFTGDISAPPAGAHRVRGEHAEDDRRRGHGHVDEGSALRTTGGQLQRRGERLEDLACMFTIGS